MLKWSSSSERLSLGQDLHTKFNQNILHTEWARMHIHTHTHTHTHTAFKEQQRQATLYHWLRLPKILTRTDIRLLPTLRQVLTLFLCPSKGTPRCSWWGVLNKQGSAGTVMQHVALFSIQLFLPSKSSKCLSQQKSGSWHVTRYRRTSHFPNRTSWKAAWDAEQHFWGRRFDNNEKVETDVRGWLRTEQPDCYRDGIFTLVTATHVRSHQRARSVSCNGRNKQHLTVQRLTAWRRKRTINIAPPYLASFIVQHRHHQPYALH